MVTAILPQNLDFVNKKPPPYLIIYSPGAFGFLAFLKEVLAEEFCGSRDFIP